MLAAIMKPMQQAAGVAHEDAGGVEVERQEPQHAAEQGDGEDEAKGVVLGARATGPFMARWAVTKIRPRAMMAVMPPHKAVQAVHQVAGVAAEDH